MTEQYYWWSNGIRRLSRFEIRKMKENMQKTPLIQEKSKKYHRLEEEKAEDLLNTIINEPVKEESIKNLEETPKKVWFIEKIRKYLFW